MQLQLTVVAAPGGLPHDVVVDIDAAASVETLRLALGRHLAISNPGPASLWLGSAALEDSAPLLSTGLHDGVMLGLGAPPPEIFGRDLPPGLHLHVVGGPDAGGAYAVPEGSVTLGRGAIDVIPLEDPKVSRRHAELRRVGREVMVNDLGSRNGTAVDGVLVTAPTKLLPGQLLRVGDSLLMLVEGSSADAALAPADDGSLTYNRPPRLLPPPIEVTIATPEEPRVPEKREFPLIAMVVPLLFGVGMAAALKNPTYLLFALMSPLMVLSNVVSDRRRGGREARRAIAEYEAEVRQNDEQRTTALFAEQQARRNEQPDAAAVLLIALGPRRRLWERRRHDDDFLALRVGLADQTARIRLVQRRKSEADPVEELVVQMVPVVVPLGDVGVLGLAGPRASTRGLARWLLGQLAVMHSPRDAGVVVLADRREAEAAWSWLRWLPHARPTDGQSGQIMLGNSAETTALRVAELTAVIKARSAVATEVGGRVDAASFPAIVVVMDGARLLRGLPGVAQVLKDGPAVGVYSICLDEETRLLPEECTATVIWSSAEPGVLSTQRTLHPGVDQIVGEQVSVAWSEHLARGLAPIRDVSQSEDESALPSAARLLDLLDMATPTPADVHAHWARSGRTTRAVIGAGLDGHVAVDLRRDGPHGLIAGTTGSGKSELLQTIVASLAVGNRPDAMTFVLVDYKGGSAFKDCVDLPHTVGMVTDLDSHLVERALSSLGAELRRREHQLAAVGAKDIEDYTELVDRSAAEPLPRLLLVIDEFASMARELPDFVSGLVNIAQRGRSLGIHLLLATQRPSGVVSPEIRANTNLRIALRVTDPAESIDVIDAAEASRISKSTPGRGYVRLAHSTLLPFQAGRVGGRARGRSGPALATPFTWSVRWGDLGTPAPQRPVTVGHEQEVTDLSVLVAAVRSAATDAGIAAQRRPWLPALPASILLDELVQSTDRTCLEVAYGIEDLPDEQLQRPAVLRLTGGGHLFAVGGPRTGRSQLLRTMAGSAARSASVSDLHIYALDCGNGALLPLGALPHCGVVVQRTEAERATRLLGRLESELKRRQAALSAAGCADIDELRMSVEQEEGMPHVLVLIDRWEGFSTTLGELDGGRLTDLVMELLREGSSVGMHFVITGDRSLLAGRISTATEDKIALRLTDRGDYGLLGLNPRHLPDDIGAGRAFRAESGAELQIALLAADPSGQAQAAAISRIAQEADQHGIGVPAQHRPFRVDVLPTRLDFAQAWAFRAGPTGPMFALVGVGGDELAALGPDLDSSVPAFVVAGPPRSGRSTTLVAMTRALLSGRTKVALMTPRPSPLRALEGERGVVASWTGGDLLVEDLQSALDEAGDAPLVVVIDDGELLKECSARELLRALVRGDVGPARALLLGGNADGLCSGLSNWQVDVRKARQGVLLSPQGLSDGDLIGARVPRSSVGGPVQPGRGLLHLGDSRLITVQVPLD